MLGDWNLALWEGCGLDAKGGLLLLKGEGWRGVGLRRREGAVSGQSVSVTWGWPGRSWVGCDRRKGLTSVRW
jgi:hypothetical protein